ncbi:MAG: D-serine ammonia-lyase, partial [Bacillota bacterium]|nr:D-serine ammonia-lyase [Bacillota bacterium]
MIDKAIWDKRVREGKEQLWINGERSGNRRFVDPKEIKQQFPRLPTREELSADRERMRAYLSEFELDMNSELRRIAEFQQMLIPVVGGRILGDWYVKMDSDMPLIGSIKARGGLYELVNHAVRLLRDAGMDDSPRGLRNDAAKELFGRHTVIVSSTGNLGISIGLLGRRIGFRVQVHMSHDAQEWKMEALRQVGAEVMLHDADYSVAVAKGREEAGRSGAYFVDDETSVDLFRGYALAAFEIAESFEQTDRPLFVYLPCGVGGAPAGVAYGLKLLLGERVHLFFAEPTASPCVLCGLASGEYDRTSVYAFGQSNRTIADGLAVPRMSGLVGPLLSNLVDGIYTVS